MLIINDSTISGIEENKILLLWRKVKVKSFPDATIEDMYDCIKPLLKKCPKNIILHIGTNNTVNETSRIALDKLLSWNAFMEEALPDCNFYISNLTQEQVVPKPHLQLIMSVNIYQHCSLTSLIIVTVMLD